WFGLRQFLAPAGEAGFADGDAGATGPFRATLAAVGFAFVGVAFARPLVLLHSATGTCRRRNRFPQTSASLLFCFHRGSDWWADVYTLYRLLASSRTLGSIVRDAVCHRSDPPPPRLRRDRRVTR